MAKQLVIDVLVDQLKVSNILKEVATNVWEVAEGYMIYIELEPAVRYVKLTEEGFNVTYNGDGCELNYVISDYPWRRNKDIEFNKVVEYAMYKEI